MLRYFITLTSFVCLLAHIQAATCPQFKCGSISQSESETNRTCVMRKSDSLYNVEACPDGYHCQAAGWNDITQAKNETKCVANSQEELSNNTVLPGDICYNNTNCFNHDNGVNCTNGACVTSYTNQTECPNIGSAPGHDYCPQGYYCSSKKCTPAKGLNDTCDDGVECKFGLACIATNGPNYDSFKCNKFYSLDINGTFDNSKIEHPYDYYLGTNNVCKSNNALLIDGSKYTCRPGNTSETSNEKDLKTKETGAECKYMAYTNKTDPEKYENVTDYSDCGFNKETSAYCPKRKGDQWFKEAYEKLSKIDFTELNCHVDSTFDKCVDAQNSTDYKIIHEYEKARLDTEALHGYHLYANNDKCVANTITAAFWDGEDPDFAMNFSLASTLLVVLNIAALMYLF